MMVRHATKGLDIAANNVEMMIALVRGLMNTGRWTESLEMTNKILEMINRGEIKQGMKMEVMIMRGNILESMEQIAGAIEQIQVFCIVM